MSVVLIPELCSPTRSLSGLCIFPLLIGGWHPRLDDWSSPSSSEGPFRASTKMGNWPLLSPLLATRSAIMPVGSFQILSGYRNSAPLICAPRTGKNIGKRGGMAFEAYERRILTHFVHLPSFGTAVELVLKYRILLIFCFLDNYRMVECSSYSSYSNSSLLFWHSNSLL